jgi:hypothetical protein
MPKIFYRNTKFREASRVMIEHADSIIEEYQNQGYTLTLRQLYYQFVSRDLIPNSQKSYSCLGDLINNARLAGVLDWDAIEDRTRNVLSRSHWTSPGDIIYSAARSFGIDRWKDQRYRAEVWVEKEALVGVFERICSQFDVPLFACRGFVSQSEMWRAAMRMQTHHLEGNDVVVLHFGDHDPSGIDMTRDIRDRFELFGVPVAVRRIALNMDQVKQYNPPPNPAKNTDSRYKDYADRYGEKSWELDALEPKTLVKLVKSNIEDLLDFDLWNKTKNEEDKHKKNLMKAAQHWDAVARYVENIKG